VIGIQFTFRSFLKGVANAVALVLAFPCAFTCWCEATVLSGGEEIFGFWTNVMALLPGLPGMYVRRAFYHMVLQSCSLECHIGFGAQFTHRAVRVEEGVYIGPYSLIGSSWLRKGCLIGSRVSLLSGPLLHERDEDGHWKPADFSKLRQVEIGESVWIGEGAVVMVNVGAGSMVGSGAVVSTRVRPNVVVAGNPARFVRRLRAEPSGEPSSAATEQNDDEVIPSPR
jgi:virginiamycin A acetyltransferase